LIVGILRTYPIRRHCILTLFSNFPFVVLCLLGIGLCLPELIDNIFGYPKYLIKWRYKNI